MWEQMYYSEWAARASAVHRPSDTAAVRGFNWIYANLGKLNGKRKGIKVHKGAQSMEMSAAVL